MGIRVPITILAWMAVAAARTYGGTFSISLQARSGEQEQTAQSRSAADPAASRPVLTAKARGSLRVQWSVVSTESLSTKPDVTVHCFLAKEDGIGQQAIPDLRGAARYESALTMDFEPRAKSSGNFVLQAPEPGDYLLRVETINPGEDRSHGEFAAMDLKVQ